jgi:putative membrane protein
MSTTALFLGLWRVDPFAVVFALATLGAYAIGRRTRSVRAFYLLAAVGAVVVAVASPVGALADGYLFSAHMLQHLVLVLVVPPLALLGFASNVDRSGRGSGGKLAPLVAWGAGVGAMWLWHAPTLCNAASQSAFVHRVQEVSLLGMGLAFWWPILAPRPAARLPPFLGMIYLFTACTACTVLGILVTFSPVEVCSIYLNPTDSLGVLPLLRQGWGLTAAKDQQIGGLLMWVPACLVYAVGILGLLARSYREAARAPLGVEGT